MSKVKELMEKRNDVLLKMTAIIDKAEEEKSKDQQAL